MTQDADSKGGWTVERYGDGDSLVIHAGPDERVCFMATPGESPGAMDRIESRARLIAAAPALLEALKWFIDDIDGTHTVMVEFDENVERARAAITQAEGGGQ